jgi:hypothetical protein
VDRICSYYNYFEEKNKIKRMNRPHLFRRIIKEIPIKIRNIKIKKTINNVSPEPFSSFSEAHDYCQQRLVENPFNSSINFLNK